MDQAFARYIKHRIFFKYATTRQAWPSSRKTLFTNHSSSNMISCIHVRRMTGPPYRNRWQYLARLEQDANAHPSDPRLQATLYKELRMAKRQRDVINRFENSTCAHDDESYRHYIAALVETGQENKVMPELMKHMEGKNTASSSSGTNKTDPVYVVVEEAPGAMFWKALRWIGVTFTYTFCLLTVLSLSMENSGLLKTSSSTQSEYEPSQQQVVKFEDVQGCDEAKDELEEIVQFLKNPHRYTELGGKLPKGVLLTGPPGTGKTLLARAVAGEASVPFFFMSGSEFDEMYVGVGARRIRELFAAARSKAPSIVFIDEIDAIGSKRNPKDQSYMKQTLNQLLVDLDGFSQTEGVIFIAATNFPELLDKALVRPGRFDRTVNVPLPDVRGRIQILRQHMKGITVASDVDVDVIARGTPGFSGAELANLINQAAIQASKEGVKEVSSKHLEFAKDKSIMGAERKSAVITDESKRLTAYHEGGHALLAYYTPGALPLHKATIMPRGRALGMTVQLPEMDKDSYTKKEYIAQIDVCMGGRVAEEMIFGSDNVTSGAHSDIVKATEVARRMVRNLGMSEKVGLVNYNDEDMHLLSTETKVLIENEIKDLVMDAEKRAREILTTHIEELHRLAKALVEYETLSQSEILDVVNNKPIQRKP
ncbi:peptidase family M41-domain-containing protein [Halteromyces radiatus]|uniref:peptidase family M41-domain-containing protein n=1 Tax=Halteromyces radiatus TaxID=101107 RepID=UPI00221F0F94|nr:peptidase family M41-domain-containing protein [Halteromyces radiatus]KAI8099032.1 peptidase family M41-domain-containing protein [Halteromyces radiatus]